MKTLKLKINTNENGISTMYAYRALHFDKNGKVYYGRLYLSEDDVLKDIELYTKVLKIYNNGYVDRVLIFV